jgi:hypothetical protein
MGGAFAPGGGRLAVFVTARGTARLALVDPATGAIRVTRAPRLALGQDSGWARWLPGAARLIVGTGAGAGYLVDAATLSAAPLSYARGTRDGQGLNYTAAVVPLPR